MRPPSRDGSWPTRGATTPLCWTGTSGAGSPPGSARSPVSLLRSFAKARPDRAVLQGLATALVVGTCGTMIVAAHAGGSLTHGEGFLTEHAPTPIRLLAGLPIPRDRSREPLTPIAEREAFDGVALRIFEAPLHRLPQPGQAQGQPETRHVRGSPGRRPVGTRRRRGGSRIQRAPEARPPPPGRQAAHAAEGKGAPDRRRDGRAGLVDRSRCFPTTTPSGHARPRRRSASCSRAPSRKANGGRWRSSRIARPPNTKPRSRACARRFPDLCARSCPGNVTSSTRRRSPARPSGMRSCRSSASVGNDLFWLDLSRTGITDAGLKVLAKMPNLERLDLRGTAVGDDGVRALAGLNKLETLSLYGTARDRRGAEGAPGTPVLATTLRRRHPGDGAGPGCAAKGPHGAAASRPEVFAHPPPGGLSLRTSRNP